MALSGVEFVSIPGAAFGSHEDDLHNWSSTDGAKPRQWKRDEEWGKKSDRWIAEKACVSNRFVSNLRPAVVNGSHVPAPAREGRDGKAYPVPESTASPVRERHRARMFAVWHRLDARPWPAADQNDRRGSGDAACREDGEEDEQESAHAPVMPGERRDRGDGLRFTPGFPRGARRWPTSPPRRFLAPGGRWRLHATRASFNVEHDVKSASRDTRRAGYDRPH